MKSQRQRILDRLKEGPLNSYEATYSMKIKQAPTRIKELREQGYKINSITKQDRSVDWELTDVPLKDKPFKWVIENGMARKVYE